jgi:uncharacterized membrane protein
MIALHVIAIVSFGLMVGVELSVSAFVNPALRQIELGAQRKAMGLLAVSLGRAMPIWYVVSFVLLVAEGYVRRHDAHACLIYAAIAILAVTIVTTIALLVPINNEIARLATGASVPDWQRQHARWDSLHRVRIVALIAALTCLVSAVAL